MNAHPDDQLPAPDSQRSQTDRELRELGVDPHKVWAGIAAQVWTRPPGWVECLAGRLFGSRALARVLITTPSLLLAWLLASAAVLTAGVLFTRLTLTPWVALLAPALAGMGIAYAYGPGADPCFELSQTMAVSGRLILLARGLVAFGLNAMLGLIATLFTADVAGLTLGWLIPMTTIAALALAAATLTRSAGAGVATALSGWCMIVLAAAVDTHNLAGAVVESDLYLWYLLGTAAGIAVALYATSVGRKEQFGWL